MLRILQQFSFLSGAVADISFSLFLFIYFMFIGLIPNSIRFFYFFVVLSSVLFAVFFGVSAFFRSIVWILSPCFLSLPLVYSLRVVRLRICPFPPTIVSKAYSTSPAIPLYVCVLFVNWVTAFTSYTHIRFATQKIFLVGDRLNMARINTVANFAKMVAFQSFWKWFDKQIIQGAVRSPTRTLVVQVAVSVWRNMSCPFPTRRFVVEMFSRYLDFGKNTGKKLSVNSDRMNTSHTAKDSPFVAMIRLVQDVQRLVRAVFIVTNWRCFA